MKHLTNRCPFFLAGRCPFFLFLMAELSLYLCILYQDFGLTAPFGTISVFTGRILRYASVLTAVCFEGFLFTFLPHHLNASASHILAALTFTAAADYFLLFSRAYRTGVLLFCLVQLLYLARTPRLPAGMLLALPPSPALFPALYFPSLFALGALYLGLSLCNLLRAFLSWHQAKPGARRSPAFFAAGLLLLLLCDLQVGASFLFSWFPATARIADNCASCIWLFYLPSLVCIVFSSLRTPPL